MQKKIAIISHTLPPDSNGQAIVLERLFRDADPETVCMISTSPVNGTSLPGRYIQIPAAPLIPFEKVARLLIGPPNLFIKVLWWAWQLIRVVRREKCKAIVACTGAAHELPAAWLASWWMSVEFYPYIFDWYQFKYAYVGGAMGAFTRWFAARIEGPMLRGATKVIVPNEFLQNAFKTRYGVESSLVRNPTCFAAVDEKSIAARVESQDESTPVRIVYTGAIYRAHIDAFRNLFQAVEEIGEERIQVDIYTDTTLEYLMECNFKGHFNRYDRVAIDQVRTVQQKADILFLPLTFNSQYPELLQTSAPGKMGDYLAAGRPVLVNAPADAFVSWWFSEHECGEVITANDPEAVKAAILRLIGSRNLRAKLGRNAARCSRRFHIDATRQQFSEIVGHQHSHACKAAA